MPYYPRKAATPPHAMPRQRAVPEEGTADERLERLTVEILKRMEAELDVYTVPQLLSGLHKCLQVRVLLITLKQKSEGLAVDVGSSVRKYAGNFQSTPDAGRGRARGGRSRTSGRYSNDDDTVINLLTDC